MAWLPFEKEVITSPCQKNFRHISWLWCDTQQLYIVICTQFWQNIDNKTLKQFGSRQLNRSNKKPIKTGLLKSEILIILWYRTRKLFHPRHPNNTIMWPWDLKFFLGCKKENKNTTFILTLSLAKNILGSVKHNRKC